MEDKNVRWPRMLSKSATCDPFLRSGFPFRPLKIDGGNWEKL